MKTMKTAMVVGVLFGALVASLGAHTRLRAVVTTDPERPVAGQPCAIRVVFVTAEGTPTSLAGWHVSLVAEMRAHPMPPVEAALVPDRAGRLWQARVSFTMPGTWDVTVRAASDHDRIAGTTRLSVGMGETPPSSGRTEKAATAEAGEPGQPGAASAPASSDVLTMAMEVDESRPPWPPWLVLGGAAGLTGLAEVLALVRAACARRPPRRDGWSSARRGPAPTRGCGGGGRLR